ncbi:MAG: outer membrane beta-barrel protein [Candidatus Acidiferrales bacterium]
MRRLVILVGIFFAIALPAAAQKLPKFEVYGGYEFEHFTTSDNSSGTLNGWSIQPAYYPFKFLGAVLDLGDEESPGYDQNNGTKVDASTHSYHAYIGPRFRLKLGRWTPFADVLFGGVYRTEETNTVAYFDSVTGDPVPTGTELSAAQFNFAVHADGGIDFKLTHHIAWRLEGGFVHTNYTITNAAIADPKQDNITASTGIVIRF